MWEHDTPGQITHCTALVHRYNEEDKVDHGWRVPDSYGKELSHLRNEVVKASAKIRDDSKPVTFKVPKDDVGKRKFVAEFLDDMNKSGERGRLLDEAYHHKKLRTTLWDTFKIMWESESELGNETKIEFSADMIHWLNEGKHKWNKKMGLHPSIVRLQHEVLESCTHLLDSTNIDAYLKTSKTKPKVVTTFLGEMVKKNLTDKTTWKDTKLMTQLDKIFDKMWKSEVNTEMKITRTTEMIKWLNSDIAPNWGNPGGLKKTGDLRIEIKKAYGIFTDTTSGTPKSPKSPKDKVAGTLKSSKSVNGGKGKAKKVKKKKKKKKKAT
eukprot:826086_1